MSTLNSRLQLSILNRKKGRSLLEKGFTLVELMIVIVIVGVLSSVALPNFLGTKSKAEAGSLTGGLVGLAKECAANAILESDELVAASSANGLTFVENSTECKTGAKFSNTQALTGLDKLTDTKCIADLHDGDTDTHCVVDVTADGVITGAWGTAVAAS
jgi:type IV pilus assembly protein PilA